MAEQKDTRHEHASKGDVHIKAKCEATLEDGGGNLSIKNVCQSHKGNFHLGENANFIHLVAKYKVPKDKEVKTVSVGNDCSLSVTIGERKFDIVHIGWNASANFVYVNFIGANLSITNINPDTPKIAGPGITGALCVTSESDISEDDISKDVLVTAKEGTFIGWKRMEYDDGSLFSGKEKDCDYTLFVHQTTPKQKKTNEKNGESVKEAVDNQKIKMLTEENKYLKGLLTAAVGKPT